MMVERLNLIGMSLQTKPILDDTTSGQTESPTELLICQKLLHRFCKATRLTWRNQATSFTMSDDLRHPSPISRHDRPSHRHRFNEDATEMFTVRWQYEHFRQGQHLPHILQPSCKMHHVLYAKLFCLPSQVGTKLPITDQHPMNRFVLPMDDGRSMKQILIALIRNEPADTHHRTSADRQAQRRTPGR
jgi:hypothetical protein